MSVASLKQDIEAAFDQVFGPGHGISSSLTSTVAAKLYEIKVLGNLLIELKKANGNALEFKLVNPSAGFQGAPGLINRGRAHIEVYRKADKQHLADIFTNTEFVALSSTITAGPATSTHRTYRSGEFHELDILVCENGLPNRTRPTHDQVYIGIECKHWGGIPKKLLREVLGVRRELSFLRPPDLPFPVSLRLNVRNSDPPSELVFAASIPGNGAGLQHEWQVPADQFEIKIWHVPA